MDAKEIISKLGVVGGPLIVQIAKFIKEKTGNTVQIAFQRRLSSERKFWPECVFSRTCVKLNGFVENNFSSSLLLNLINKIDLYKIKQWLSRI